MPIPRRNKVATKTIDMSLLKPVQPCLSEAKLKLIRNWMTSKSKFFIHVVKQNEYYYIWNGHHRAYIAAELGLQTIEVKEVADTENWIAKKLSQHENLSDLLILEHEKFKVFQKNWKERKIICLNQEQL